MQTILWGMFGALIAIVWTLNEIRDARHCACANEGAPALAQVARTFHKPPRNVPRLALAKVGA
jgi:hypothetical protein